jgi:U3 small nucleolar RNA-associated protein 3
VKYYVLTLQGFDENDWLVTSKTNDAENEGTITEVMRDIEITSEMAPEERLQILKSQYPEFEFLADEFVALRLVFEDLQHQLGAEEFSHGIMERPSSTTVKCRALAAYTASLAMYFALFSSPAHHSNATKPIDSDELHDHPVCKECDAMSLRIY